MPATEPDTRPPAFPVADSHCHIDLPAFDADRAQVVDRARDAGVETMLLIGGIDEEQGHRRALAVAATLGLPVSAGVHPHEARLATPAIYEELRTLAAAKRIVAIGEIGLDFHYDHSPRQAQREAFRAQVRLAKDARLPVIIHTREADDETAALLEAEEARAGVIHCFTGGRELAERALAMGFYISFSGIIAFPRSQVIQDVARSMPLDRILVETDSPFLAPPPHRGKRNEPAFVVEVVKTIARLRGEAPAAVGAAALANFRRAFAIA